MLENTGDIGLASDGHPSSPLLRNVSPQGVIPNFVCSEYLLGRRAVGPRTFRGLSMQRARGVKQREGCRPTPTQKTGSEPPPTFHHGRKRHSSDKMRLRSCTAAPPNFGKVDVAEQPPAFRSARYLSVWILCVKAMEVQCT